MIWLSLDSHVANFIIIQTHLSRLFYLAVDSLGLALERIFLVDH